MQSQAVAETEKADGASNTKKLWGGRFTGATDPLMEKFNESLPFDRRMWHEDTRVRRRFCFPVITMVILYSSNS